MTSFKFKPSLHKLTIKRRKNSSQCSTNSFAFVVNYDSDLERESSAHRINYRIRFIAKSPNHIVVNFLIWKILKWKTPSRTDEVGKLISISVVLNPFQKRSNNLMCVSSLVNKLKPCCCKSPVAFGVSLSRIEIHSSTARRTLFHC